MDINGGKKNIRQELNYSLPRNETFIASEEIKRVREEIFSISLKEELKIVEQDFKNKLEKTEAMMKLKTKKIRNKT